MIRILTLWKLWISAIPDIDDKQTVEDKLNKLGESPMEKVVDRILVIQQLHFITTSSQ